jgi:hypothetical protein
MTNLVPLLTSRKKNEYRTRHNTSALTRKILTSQSVDSLSGDAIWNLIRLTWVSRGPEGVSISHWRTLKVPAVAQLFKFKDDPQVLGDLHTTISAMGLPLAVAQAAAKNTRIVNLRPTWRNSSRDWCGSHVKELKRILRDTLTLGSNDERRYSLAIRIEQLPPIKSPGDKADLRPVVLLSPLIACLDPKCRFPILNGRQAVTRLLRRLELAHSGLSNQVRGLMGIIGQFGITDAFMLDTLSEEVIKHVHAVKRVEPRKWNVAKESPLRSYDEEERKAVRESQTITYRKRHDRMTNALGRIFKGFDFVTKSSPAGRCDAFVRNYDGAARDLLVEAKPEPDKGSIRIAIGQLFDYRRYLPHQAAADLAMLTISQPVRSYIDLLMDLGITALWFDGENCKSIGGGEGKAWSALAKTSRFKVRVSRVPSRDLKAA